MGYSLSLIATQTKNKEHALSHLGLAGTGRLCKYATEKLSGYALPENWFLVVAQGCDSPLLQPEVLGPLSLHFPVVACSVEEHVMFSAAEYWTGGGRTWRVEHVGEDGPIHLETSGDLTPNFEAIAAAHKAQQEADGGANAGVDHYFEIPLNLARSIMGFKHDEEIPGVDYKSFEVLVKAAPDSADKPWWRFWK